MVKTSSKTSDINVRGHRISSPAEFALNSLDGGWAWVVLFATFIAGLTTVAPMSTFAVILNDLESLQSATTTTLSWTPSVEISTGLFLGPMYTAIINKWGCRKATILGGMLIFSGLTMSYFVTRVEFLILTYGVTVGMGSGICYIVYPVILSHHFKKYFGVAVGCLVASYAASRLIITPLAQIILDEYGCKATMLLMGAVTLHICVGGCLYQPVKWNSLVVPVNEEADNKHLQSKTVEILNEAVVNVHSEKREANTRLLQGNVNQLTEVAYMNLHSDSIKYATSLESVNSAVTEDIGRCASEGPNEKSCMQSLCMRGMCRTVDHSLWKEPLFYIVSLSELIIVAIMIYSNVFLFPLGIEIGLPSMKTASVISAKATADIFGRLAGPALITLMKLPMRNTFIVLNLIHAIILAVFIMAKSGGIYISMSVLSGLIFGNVVGLKNVLIAEYMGVKRLSSVIGLSAFLQGFLLLPMAPIMGWIRDSTGSFKEIFLFLSGLEVVMVILWSLQPGIAKFTNYEY